MSIVLTDQQQAAVDMVQHSRISVLVGGPGTGKTTTVNQIVAQAKKQKKTVFMAAPTGKAAKRMMEATGKFASTIHSMLGWKTDGEDHYRFSFNADDPLPCDLLILDEVSMIDSLLMADVLAAIDPEKTRLLLVGDQDQLPSVGPGAVLRDLLASGKVPHVELDVVHRNAGTIVRACHAIKKGQRYEPDKAIDLTAVPPANLIHVECASPEITLDTIETIVCDRMPLRGYDPVNDVQVISPVNDRGELSCKTINERLRNRLNPGDDDQGEFRVGDRVINTMNGRFPGKDNRECSVVNGDIGFVREFQKKGMIVEFFDPERQVLMSKKAGHLLHAYCITCHRFQGSEAPVVVIPVHRQFNYFLSNPWIYTALSRGKEIVITVGTFDTIVRAIKNTTPNTRTTMLKEFLQGVE